MLGLVLRLLFVSGTDGAGTGAVWGTVAIVLMEAAKDKNTFNDSEKKKILPESCSGGKEGVSLSCVCVWKPWWRSKQAAELTHIIKPHLPLLQILHPAHKRQIEADSEAVLEEEGGPAAVQLSFGDDGDAVAQQVGLVHVMSGQNHGPAC